MAVSTHAIRSTTLAKLAVTFKGTLYDVTVTGDSILEIEKEYEKVKKHLGKMTSRAAHLKREKEKIPKASTGLLNQRLMELVEEDFFTIPKTMSEARAELRNRGYHYSHAAVGMALLGSVRRRVLRRIFETKDDKKQYLYTNP